MPVREPDSPEVLERFHANLDLVEIIARQVFHTVNVLIDRDDLLSSGREGLLEAARRYDPSRGIPFRSYASFRVRGALLDGVRHMSALPRRAYERLAGMEAALLASEGEAESALSEVGAILDEADAEEALDEHLAAMATAAAIGIVAERMRSGSVDDRVPPRDPEEMFAKAELLAHVRDALTELSPDEAEVIRSHYFEGELLDEVARRLDISKSWASRLHTRAIARLTKRMRGLGD